MHTCRICGWSGEAYTINVKEMQYNTGDVFEYFECGNCHCMQIGALPPNLQRYYGNTYYSYEKPQISKADSSQQLNTSSVLDVGCGAGEFLCKLAKQGFVNLTGCDPFIDNDIFYENGVRIYKKEIHEMTGQFDNIFFNDSFEHVTDPHEVMESVKRLLSPEGILQIRIPVYPNIAFELFKENWYQLDAPRHISLHTKESMHYLAQKHGFKIIKREYDSGSPQIVRSYLYSQGITLWEQTSDVILKHFTPQSIDDIQETCKIANENECGDHAAFYLAHADNI